MGRQVVAGNQRDEFNIVSAPFNIGNGVRRGGVLSPSLFCRYINDLLLELASTKAGCYIGNLCYNLLSYADDLVLCAPSWVALQSLIDVLFKNVTVIGVCMVFSPYDRSKG